MKIWYLKYEKTLYELTEQQADEVRRKIENGGKIYVRGNIFMAGKCELVDTLPYNRDEYEIQPIHRETLPQGKLDFQPRSKEDNERISKTLSEMREELSEKLSWPTHD